MTAPPLAGRYLLERKQDNLAPCNIFTEEELRVKVESLQAGSSTLENEFRVRRSLTGGIGIPNVHWFGEDGTNRYLILDETGPSLNDLLRPCNGRFSLKTVSLVADQLISRLEFIHSRSLVHRNVTPDSFTVGVRKQGAQVFCADFSKAERYTLEKSLEHIPYRENLTAVTTLCASINAQRGIEQSRRDDMESLGNMLLFFYFGSLPGAAPNTASVEALCSMLPAEFKMYFERVWALEFTEKPDYDFLRKLFRDLCGREGIDRDHDVDWLVYKGRYDLSSPGTSGPGHIGSSLFRQPEIELISDQQRLDEVERISNSVALAELKCGKIIGSLSGQRLSDQQWRVLFALYQVFVEECADLLRATRWPNATASVRALQRDIGAKMWQLGIRPLIDLLHGQLPHSKEHMLRFLNFGYSMMGLLAEIEPTFLDCWIKCLGDLARYRAALEDTDSPTCEAWNAVAKSWHTSGAPSSGRLQDPLVSN